MRASKEAARVAADTLAELCEDFTQRLTDEQRDKFHSVAAFINAARRKLPTEAAYQRDANRRRVKS